MMKVVTFGEIMMRLNPPRHLRLPQTNSLEMTFAGGEVNVAVSLANYGICSMFVTKLPDNNISKTAVKDLKRYDLDVSRIAYGGERMGIYFVEKGASQRPSTVIYDRKHSSIATASADNFDWDDIFDQANWFHFTGITPALSESAADICLQACRIARQKGITVSCDLNYRKNLWNSEQACKIMTGLMEYTDVCIANEDDANKVFGIKALDSDIQAGKIVNESYISVAEQLVERFGFKYVAITLRGSISADDNNWAGLLYNGKESSISRNYLIHIVDRIGGGDSFAGALIYALLTGYQDKDAIEFAIAASCLKQTIEYDFNQVTVKEVEALMNGDASGRVKR